MLDSWGEELSKCCCFFFFKERIIISNGCILLLKATLEAAGIREKTQGQKLNSDVF